MKGSSEFLYVFKKTGFPLPHILSFRAKEEEGVLLSVTVNS